MVRLTLLIVLKDYQMYSLRNGALFLPFAGEGSWGKVFRVSRHWSFLIRGHMTKLTRVLIIPVDNRFISWKSWLLHCSLNAQIVAEHSTALNYAIRWFPWWVFGKVIIEKGHFITSVLSIPAHVSGNTITGKFVDASRVILELVTCWNVVSGPKYAPYEISAYFYNFLLVPQRN